MDIHIIIVHLILYFIFMYAMNSLLQVLIFKVNIKDLIS